MKKAVALATIMLAWQGFQTVARADDDDRQQVYRERLDRGDIERQEDKIAHDRAELRHERREGDQAGVRQEEREISREERRIDRDREGISGSSRDPYEHRYEEDR